jgi:hypothetical protein
MEGSRRMSKTPCLADIQREFQQFLFNPQENIHNWVISTTDLSAQARLDIYAQAYRLRLCEALAIDFAALKSVAGDELFQQWCTDYIDTHPSHYFSIRYFGQHFPTFLTARNYLDFAEFAQFEWLLSAAFDSADNACLTRETLAQLSIDAWPTLQLTLHTSVHFFACHSNAPLCWQQFTNKENIDKLIMSEEKQTWLIWRQHLTVYFRSLTAFELKALLLLKKGSGWAELCTELATPEEHDVSVLIAGCLNTWINDGVLACL